jgi:hypothetical protein
LKMLNIIISMKNENIVSDLVFKQLQLEFENQ